MFPEKGKEQIKENALPFKRKSEKLKTSHSGREFKLNLIPGYQTLIGLYQINSYS